MPEPIHSHAVLRRCPGWALTRCAAAVLILVALAAFHPDPIGRAPSHLCASVSGPCGSLTVAAREVA